jgi:hypothetical protein
MDADPVRRWLEAADRMRQFARIAEGRAATAGSARIAKHFQCEADLHRTAADSFEKVARASFDLAERRMRLAHRPERRLATTPETS